MTKKILCTILFSTLALNAFSATKPITLVLDWFVNPTHVPIIVAQEQGYFADEGISVNIITPSNADDPPKLVAIDKVDMALDYQPEFYLQQKAGLSITRLGTLVNKPLRAIVAFKNKGNSLADFKGKTIADASPGIDSALLGTMLSFNGLSLSEVNFVAVNYNLVQALLSGKADAISGVYRTVEVPQLEMMGKQLSVFYPEDNGVPSYDEMIFVVNTAKINDPRYAAFLRAVKKGAAYTKAHPKESFALLIKHHPELNTPFYQRSFTLSIPYFAEDPAMVDKARYATFEKWLMKQKLGSFVQG
jgi:putative hydroxymethylpyrimidine transport system substrate-binding protein